MRCRWLPNITFDRTENLPRKSRHFSLTLGGVEWIGEYFERGYAQRWGLEPPSGATHEEVRCLSELLQLESGDQLLDIGCGHGRHAVAFGELGVSVTGLDGSAALLDQARELADRSGVAVAWVGLKVVNAEPIMANFQSTGHEERAGAIVEISRTLTLDPPRVPERIVISGARGDGRYERRQRLYRIGDLSVVLRTAGLAMRAVLETVSVPSSTQQYRQPC